MTEVCRFSVGVRQDELPDLFRDPAQFETVDVGLQADFGPLREKFEELQSKGTGSALIRAAWDRELVEPLHAALKHIPKRTAADMRLWHWLCTVELRDIVWVRWYGRIPDEPDEQVFTRALSGRFLGSRSLSGVSRNALARLWWCGEMLYSPKYGYSLAQQVLEKQDLFQNIYERKFGLYPPAARACVKSLRDSKEEEWRFVTRVLDHYFTTMAVETLTEENIADLITEVLASFE